MSTHNRVVFATTRSVAETITLAVLASARKQSNMACVVWAFDWVESNQLNSLYDWMEANEDLEEHWMFFRIGESDHDTEVMGLYEDCGYGFTISGGLK